MMKQSNYRGIVMAAFVFAAGTLLVLQSQTALAQVTDQIKDKAEEVAEDLMQSEEFDVVVEVEGMFCERCEENCKKKLEELDEVEAAKVELDENRALIQLKEGQMTTKERITEAITEAGFKVGEFIQFPETEETEGE